MEQTNQQETIKSRNRLQAQKSRERRKQLAQILHNRIADLREEGRRYRAWIDDFYSQWNGKSSIKQLQSAEVCGNIFDDYEIVKNYDKDCYSALKSAHKRTRLPVNAPVHVKEAARKASNRHFSHQVRLRNLFILIEHRILVYFMDKENKSLRDFLSSIGIITETEAAESEMKATEAKKEISKYEILMDFNQVNDFITVCSTHQCWERSAPWWLNILQQNEAELRTLFKGDKKNENNTSTSIASANDPVILVMDTPAKGKEHGEKNVNNEFLIEACNHGLSKAAMRENPGVSHAPSQRQAVEK